MNKEEEKPNFTSHFSIRKERNEHPSIPRYSKEIIEYRNQRSSLPFIVDQTFKLLYDEWNVLYIQKEKLYHMLPPVEFFRPSTDINLRVSDDGIKLGSLVGQVSPKRTLSIPESMEIKETRTSFTEEEPSPVDRPKILQDLLRGKSYHSKLDENFGSQTLNEKSLSKRNSNNKRKVTNILNVFRRNSDAKRKSGDDFLLMERSSQSVVERGTTVSSDSYEDDDIKRKSSIVHQIETKGIREDDLSKITSFSKTEKISYDVHCKENDLSRIMSVYNPKFEWKPVEETNCQRLPNLISPYPDSSKEILFTLTADRLDFNLFAGPLFLKIALYDVKNNKKISEDWEFELNSKEELKFLNETVQNQIETQRKNNLYEKPKALFTIQDPNPQIYLVLWVEKIIDGPLDETLKMNRDGSKTLEKRRKKLLEKWKYLSAFRQPFFWGFEKLFYMDNERLTIKEADIRIREFYKVPEDGMKNQMDIINLLKNQDLLKGKALDVATFKFEINAATPDKLYQFGLDFQSKLLNASQSRREFLKYYEHFQIKDRKNSKNSTKETLYKFFTVIQDFPERSLTPNLHFNNSFYIYPKSVNSNLKNIFIKIYYKDEKIKNRIGNPADETNLKEYHLTSVTYHQKNPQFFDEIRVDVPMPPNEKQTIVFEFYGVKTSKENTQPTEFGNVIYSKIGYSYLGLYKNHAYIKDGNYDLPVYKPESNEYSQPEQIPKCKFSVTVKYGGNVFTQDSRVGAFFYKCQKLKNLFKEYPQPVKDLIYYNKVKEFLQNSLEIISKLKETNIFDNNLSFMHHGIIFNSLFNFLINIDASKFIKQDEEEDDNDIYHKLQTKDMVKQIQIAIFETFDHWLEELENLTKQYGRENTILNTYVQYFFTNPQSSNIPFYVYLLQIWNQNIAEGKEKFLMTKFDWFFFDLILKSITEYEYEIQLEKLYLEVKQFLKNYLNLFITDENEEEKSNYQFVLFLRDLLPILGIEQSLDLIFDYFTILEKKSKINLHFKLQFLHLFLDYHQYFDILLWDESKKLANHFTNNLYDGISNENEEIRVFSIYILKSHLTKLDYDAKYGNTESGYKRIICELYFNLIEKILSDGAIVISKFLNDFDNLFDLLIVFFEIFYNSGKDEEYLNAATPNQILAFLDVLITTVISLKMSDDSKLKYIGHSLHMKYFKIFIQFLERNLQIIEEGKLPEDQSQVFFDIFDRACQYLLNVLVSKIDSQTKLNGFEILLEFVKKFKNLFVLSANRKLKQIENHNNSAHSVNWNSLLGAVLLHSEFPTKTLNHPIVDECLSELISIFLKVETEIPTEEVTDDENDIEYTDDNNILAATLRKLVERLFYKDEGYGFQYYKVFFLTYLSFATPIQVLQEIRCIFKNLINNSDNTDNTKNSDNPKKPLLRNIFSLIKVLEHWIKEHYYDLDAEFIALFTHFLNCELTQCKIEDANISGMIKPVKMLFQKKLLEIKFTRKTSNTRELPKPIVPPRFTKKMLLDQEKTEFNILEWDSREIARQITLIDFALFKNIHHKECFNRKWNAKELHVKLKHAKYITEMTERFNNMTRWIVTLILNKEDVQTRAKVISKFVDIASELKELRNFHGLNSIVGALNSTGIHRLKKTWKLIPDDYAKFDEYRELLSHPYQNLRRELEFSEKPTIPFLGMHLTDLIFIEDGNSNTRQSKTGKELINFMKRTLYARVIEQIQQKQQKHYEFEVIPYLQRVLTQEIKTNPFPILNDDEEWERSIQLEPIQK